MPKPDHEVGLERGLQLGVGLDQAPPGPHLLVVEPVGLAAGVFVLTAPGYRVPVRHQMLTSQLFCGIVEIAIKL